MQFLKILWDFTRPHTIIGSFVSITALYFLSLAIAFKGAAADSMLQFGGNYLLTLLSSLSCNIYITGLNQIQDIAIDRINKPWLPIADGRLSKKGATQIVVVSGILSLVFAALGGIWLLGLILLIMAIGTAYSLPPLQLKRHHVLAALCILLVRGVLVNVGMPIHFLYSFTGTANLPVDVWPITVFVIGFSLGIAWFKDIPDTKGDAAHQINTLAISITPKRAFRYGVVAVAFSYIGVMLLAAIFKIKVNQVFFILTHSFLLLLFLYGASRLQLDDSQKLKQFYLLFWGFFFAEYIIYPLSYYL